MTNKYFKYTEAQRQEVLQLRADGVTQAEIEAKTGVNQGTQRAWFAKAGLRVTAEQRKNNDPKRTSTPEKDAAILADRLSGMTREQVAAKHGVKVSYIKKLQYQTKTVMPMEVRQENAYKGRLAVDPNAMAEMRKTLTPEVVARRSESIRRTYADNTEHYSTTQSQSSTEWWVGMSEADKARYLEARNKASNESEAVQRQRATLASNTGASNYKSIKLMARHNVKSMDELMAIYAAKHGGQYNGGYVHSLQTCNWTCSEGHTFKSRPNAVQQGQWCPICARAVSHSEMQLFEYIKSFYPEAQNNVRRLLPSKRMELDIWIPSLKKAIEFDGEYWHDRDEARERDLRKNGYCEEVGIKLFRVKYSDWCQDPESVKVSAIGFLGAA